MIFTEHYKFAAFIEGDFFNALADKQRFSTIDNQLYRTAEIIGDGVIDGWDISNTSDLELSITPGNGLIEKFYVNTFNTQTFNLLQSTNYNVYVQRRIGIIGNSGPRSSIAHIEYVDAAPPVVVQNFSAITIDSFTVFLEWSLNTEADIGKYIIERSVDNSNFIVISTLSNQDSFFEDHTDEDSFYYYRISVVDLSGYVSGYSYASTQTPLSNITPVDPFDVKVVSSEAALNVLWQQSPAAIFANINHYKLICTELNSDDTEKTDSVLQKNVDKNIFYERFDGLIIGQKYKITVKTVDTKNRESNGISFNLIPQPTPAPRDPQNIQYSISESTGGVEINLSWDNGDTPYDPATTYRYKIYTTIDGQNESLGIDVPIEYTSEQVSLYTFDLIEYFPIPENTTVTFRITAIDENGHESYGNYVRLKTTIFTPPKAVNNLQARFNENDATIIIDWINPSRTKNVFLTIFSVDPDLEDEYNAGAILIDSFIGNINHYVITNVLLNYKYTIQVYPYDIDGNAGPVTTVVQTTIIPGGLPLPSAPTQVTSKTNDKQISLSWEESSTLYTKYYKIYKKNDEISFDYSDWNLLDTLPSNLLTFVDYGLINNEIYSYYITSVDVYGRESLHLKDDLINLNYIEAKPLSGGNLTEPTNIQLTLGSNNSVILTWDYLNEEFDSFSIYRSINNLHEWELIDTVSSNISTYTDIQLPLIDHTVFYYTIEKSVNDADFRIQSSSISPEHSILIAKIETNTTTISNIDTSYSRNILNLVDPITEYVDQLILPHKHTETGKFNPNRIDLNSKLIVTDWQTTDGRIFTTTEDIAYGTFYVLKVNNRFPKVYYNIDSLSKRIIFNEPITSIDQQTGIPTDDVATIELQVFGIEEVQNILDNTRFSDIHAKQIGFGRFPIDQISSINHDGRIKEDLLPKQFLLEKIDNHTFIVPQDQTDVNKTFGDGTTFYAINAVDAVVDSLFDFEQYDNNTVVSFQKPSYSNETFNNLKVNTESVSISLPSSVANDYVFYTDRFYICDNTSLYSVTNDLASINSVGYHHDNKIVSSCFDTLRERLYVVSSDTTTGGTSVLKIIDPATGELYGLLTINIAVDYYISAIEVVSGILYGCLVNISGVTSTLVIIDPDIGSVVSVGSMNTFRAGSVIVGLAHDVSTSITYAISNDIINGWLLTVNLTTGGTATIGHPGVGALISITHDHTNSILLAVGSTNLYSINKTTGIATNIGAHTFVGIKCISAPPHDFSFYISGNTNTLRNDRIRFGDFWGFKTNTYLNFPINTISKTALTTNLVFTAHYNELSNGTGVRLKITFLDPSSVISTDTSSNESIKSYPELGSILWVPDPWATNESGTSTRINISSIINSFIARNDFVNDKNIFIKISTESDSTKNNYRTAETYSSTLGRPYLEFNYISEFAGVTSSVAGFNSDKSYKISFQFADADKKRWVMVSTKDAEIKPNPVIDLRKNIEFRILNTQFPIYLTFGIREIDKQLSVGSDGGTTGPIEWVGITNVIVNDDNSITPVGMMIKPSNEWQLFNLNLKNLSTISYSGGNSILDKDYGTISHIAFTVDPENYNTEDVISIYIDNIQQTQNLMFSGTSQGLLKSDDFGSTWSISRLTQTPVHKFYKSTKNSYLWAISANQVLFSKNTDKWFIANGLFGIKFIRDIIEDSYGNIYASTDRGVYRLEVATLTKFGRFKQTQPISAFTTDCYGLYVTSVPSGNEEIWVSTEIGIYKTTDYGRTWENTNFSSQNLSIYQFIEISDSNIIAVTKKHILRKLSTDYDFNVICNFENSFGIYDIWKIAFCNNKLYISTGTGIFTNKNNDLNDRTISDIAFEQTFKDIDFNSSICFTFGIDTIDFGDEIGERLFIGQENRLLSADENNTVTLKKEYVRKELPEFFIDNEEIINGYIYNAFNNVLCFREPVDIDKIIYAAYLPRTTYIAQNKGWAQTKFSADVFVFKNGLHTWIDWKSDDNDILAELQTVQGNLNSLPTLTTFNSLYPKSQTYLDATLSSITTIKTGGENNTFNISDETISNFLNNYTILLSTLNSDIKLVSNLAMPQIQITGIKSADRKPLSRASATESRLDFTAEDSTAINIDTLSGTIDFTSALQQATDTSKKEKLSFTKYDQLQISIFGANINDVGEFTHTDIENKFEDINTGLPSNLARVAVTNLIKTGIFIEKQHNNVFDQYNVSNVQSKFYAAYTNIWYDILNSTIDYESIVKVNPSSQPRFANNIIWLESDEYGKQLIWVSTDNGIIEYNLDNDMKLALNNLILPGDNNDSYIKYLYINSSIIYAITQNVKTLNSYIYKTNDFGGTWKKLNSINLPATVNKITIINGNLVAATENGIFYSDNDLEEWYQADLVFPTGKTEDTNIKNSFISTIHNIENSNFVITESDSHFYTSGQGIEFIYSGSVTSDNIKNINKIYRFKNITFIATNSGLYSDSNSILSNSVAFDLVQNITETSDESLLLHINDITSCDDMLFVCDNSGNLYRFFDEDTEDSIDNAWKKYKIPMFDSVHNISAKKINNQYFIIASCYEKILLLDITPITGIFN